MAAANTKKKNGGKKQQQQKQQRQNGANGSTPVDQAEIKKKIQHHQQQQKKKKKHQQSGLVSVLTSTPFMVGVVVVILSIVLSYEPVAVQVDNIFGTATSRQHQHERELLKQRQLDDEAADIVEKAIAASGRSEMNLAADRLCDSFQDDPTSPSHCMPAPTNAETPFDVMIQNDSQYRIDIHWENDTGDSSGKKSRTVIANVEGFGASQSLRVFPTNRFYITRHGVREGLFYKSKPLWFIPTKINQRFVVPNEAEPSQDKCIDRYELQCLQYAQDGQCWQTPGWMIVHCCESCEKFAPELNARQLVDVSERCTKERMNITEPIWKSGDLNALFEEWTTSPKYAKYSPTIHSSPSMAIEESSDGDENDHQKSPPWVITFDNFFSEEEAKALIEGGYLAGFDRSTNQGKTNEQGEMEMVESVTRTSSNAWCTGDCQQLPLVKTVTKRIEEVTRIPSSHYEPFQVLDYGPDQFYKMHHDSTGRDPKPSGNRILTFFMYLSDVEEGGETKFNQLQDGLKITPKLGRALIWPSVLNDEPDFWDDRMYHEAMPVVKGKKYAANHWIHLNDYETPNLWGCTGSFA
mmetsp:Transcript_25451/g.60201  ORF Transcript_25451/g.60201 Transcript_25451/m.60201 type:complete len:578 (+) Transcript_25451:101-1834(+)